MRFRVVDRMLAALSGLLICALGILLGLYGAGVLPEVDLSFMQGPFTVWQRAIIIAAAFLLFLLGVHGLWMLFRRRADKGFIVQRTDMGDMCISMSALKSMVRKCVDQHQEISVKKTHIHRLRNGVIVDLKILLANGINIPLTVNVLQKQIKQYITSCSGVDVHEVRVQVDTSNLPVEMQDEEIPVLEQNAAPAALLQEEPVVENSAKSILRHTEEPADYVETVPVNAYEAPVAAAEEMPVAEDVIEDTIQQPVEEVAEESAAYTEEAIEFPTEAAAEEMIEETFEEAPVEVAQEEETVVETAEEFVEEAAEAYQQAETFFDEMQEKAQQAEEEGAELWAQVDGAFIRQDESEEAQG